MLIEPGRIHEKERGQNLLELALSMVLLLLLLAGIFDLGRAIFTLMALQDAAEEGVVYGIAFPDQCGNIENRVRYDLSTGVRPEATSVSVQIKNSSGAFVDCSSISTAEVVAGREMLVEVSQDFQITMPFIGSVIGQTIPLRATANGVLLRPQP
jgi:Flp pilus assembly protein TadG